MPSSSAECEEGSSIIPIQTYFPIFLQIFASSVSSKGVIL